MKPVLPLVKEMVMVLIVERSCRCSSKSRAFVASPSTDADVQNGG